MLKRLAFGFLKGILIGGLLSLALAQVFPTAMGGGIGYAFACLSGILVGLVAGKPIWAKGALVEVGLKSAVGAGLAAALLFGIRYISVSIPSLLKAPSATLGYHLFASLVSISLMLSLFYEMDDDGVRESDDKNSAGKKRVDAPAASAQEDEFDEMLDEEEPKAKKKR